jgi:hypothetical protein
MKLHPYDILSAKFDIKNYLLSRKLIEKLYYKYPELELDNQIIKLGEILKYGTIENKTILDLGCGCINSQDEYFNSKAFEPWLARILYENNSNIIGIDNGDLSKEKFENYSLDITKTKLDFIKSNSIDIVCANAFFDSPSLKMPSKKLFNELIPKLEKIVKLDGVFIYETTGL